MTYIRPVTLRQTMLYITTKDQFHYDKPRELRRDGGDSRCPCALLLEVVVSHCADAGVGPYVFGGFHHVDDGVDGQDDAEDGDRGTDARHQRERQEEAAHGDTCIADGGDDGDEEPQEDGAKGEGRTAVLHYEE